MSYRMTRHRLFDSEFALRVPSFLLYIVFQIIFHLIRTSYKKLYIISLSYLYFISKLINWIVFSIYWYMQHIWFSIRTCSMYSVFIRTCSMYSYFFRTWSRIRTWSKKTKSMYSYMEQNSYMQYVFSIYSYNWIVFSIIL